MITQRPGGSARLGLHSLGMTLCGTSSEHCFHIVYAHVKDLRMTLLLPCGWDRTEWTGGVGMRTPRRFYKSGVRHSNVTGRSLVKVGGTYVARAMRQYRTKPLEL